VSGFGLRRGPKRVRPFAWNRATVTIPQGPEWEGAEQKLEGRLVVTRYDGEDRATLFDHMGNVIGQLVGLDGEQCDRGRGKARLVTRDGDVWYADDGGCGCH